MASLRDINLKLKGQLINTKTKKDPIVFQIWVKRKNKFEFFTEASTLNHYQKKWSRNKCPYCSAIYGNKDKTSEDNISWMFKCPGCGSSLEVYKE